MQNGAKLNARKGLKMDITKKLSKPAGEQLTEIEIKDNGGKQMLKLTTTKIEPEFARMLTIKRELAALDDLNHEYPSLSQVDREALDELNLEGEQLKRELARLSDEHKKRKGEALALRAEAGRVGACLNPLCGVDASGRVVRGGYIVPRIIDPRPSIRPAA